MVVKQRDAFMTLKGFLPDGAYVMARRLEAEIRDQKNDTNVQHSEAQELKWGGTGTTDASLVFVWNSNSDPRKSQAAQLIEKMILALGMNPKEVFVADTTTSSAVALQPKMVVAMGEFTEFSALKKGEILSQGNYKLMSTLDPYTLLDQPDSKKQVWNHLKQVAAELGHTIPTRGATS